MPEPHPPKITLGKGQQRTNRAYRKNGFCNINHQWTMEDVETYGIVIPQSAHTRLAKFVKGMMKRGTAVPE